MASGSLSPMPPGAVGDSPVLPPPSCEHTPTADGQEPKV